LAKERDTLGVTAEGADVVANPFYSETLIKKAEVGAVTGGAGEAEDVNAVAGLRVSKEDGLRV
jgi:hypothetical protein